jgi:hypothetical protein
MKNKIIVSVGFFFFLILLFRNWFSLDLISSGDFGYLYKETIEKLSIFPYAWDSSFGLGLGGNISFILALNTWYFTSAYLLQVLLQFSWNVIERIVWFWPFLAVSIFSSVYVCKKMFPTSKYWFISPILFLCNTYALMLVGGGQMGVAMGYALAPLVLYLFVKEFPEHIESSLMRGQIIAGFALAAQIMFDARMAYVTMIGVGIYILINFLRLRSKLIQQFFIPVGIAVLLHFFWILPLFFSGSNPIVQLGSAYSTGEAVKYFSFADFSHALSLLHPNWPENIFGKIRFLQPEFLIIPILAFASLLFVRQASTHKKQKSNMLFFALLGLTGVFLAKGANQPFGAVYLWLFNSIPGFILFRDPSKFYLLIAVSYSVLIPITIDRIVLLAEHTFGHKEKPNTLFLIMRVIIVSGFLLYWGIAHREAVTGELRGTFVSHAVPIEYIHLKDYLAAQSGFSRVLWVPERERYGYFSGDKPGLSLDAFGVASSSSFIPWIENPQSNEQLRRYAVSYIVVPTDPQGELFITDRKPDQTKRNAVVSALRTKDTLTEISGFGGIAVFQTKNLYSHMFFADTPQIALSNRRITPTYFELSLPAFSAPRKIIFSEAYDPHWELQINGEHISPSRTQDGLQEYMISKSSGQKVTIKYRLQQWVVYGSIISCVTFFVIGYVYCSLFQKVHVMKRYK